MKTSNAEWSTSLRTPSSPLSPLKRSGSAASSISRTSSNTSPQKAVLLLKGAPSIPNYNVTITRSPSSVASNAPQAQKFEAPTPEREAMLSTLLSQKIRDQAQEIQRLSDRLARAENPPEKVRLSMAKQGIPIPEGKEGLVARDGPLTFKEKVQLTKEMHQVRKEYDALSNRLNEANAHNKFLATTLATREKEMGVMQRQLSVAQKSLGEARHEAIEAKFASKSQTDAEAMKRLAQAAKTLQKELDEKQDEIVQLQARLEGTECQAEEGEAYIAMLKQALDVKANELGVEAPGKGGLLEELLMLREENSGLKQKNQELKEEILATGSEAMQATRDELESQKDACGILQQLIEKLEGEKGAALEYIEKMDSRFEAAEDQARRIEELTTENEVITEELKEGEQERRRLKIDLDGLKTQLEEQDQFLTKRQSELEDAKALQEELLQAVKDAKEETLKTEANTKSLEDANVTLRKQLDEFAAVKQRQDTEMAEMHSRLHRNSAELAESERKVREVQQSMNTSIQREVQKAADESALIQRKVDEERSFLGAHLNEARNAMASAEVQLEAHVKELAAARERIAELEAQALHLSRQTSETEKKCDQLQHSLSMLGIEKRDLEQQLNARIQEDHRVRQLSSLELNRSEARNEEREIEMVKLESQVAHLSRENEGLQSRIDNLLNLNEGHARDDYQKQFSISSKAGSPPGAARQLFNPKAGSSLEISRVSDHSFSGARIHAEPSGHAGAKSNHEQGMSGGYSAAEAPNLPASVPMPVPPPNLSPYASSLRHETSNLLPTPPATPQYPMGAGHGQPAQHHSAQRGYDSPGALRSSNLQGLGASTSSHLEVSHSPEITVLHAQGQEASLMDEQNLSVAEKLKQIHESFALRRSQR